MLNSTTFSSIRRCMQSFMMLPVLMAPKVKGGMSSELTTMKTSFVMMIEMMVGNGNILNMHAQYVGEKREKRARTAVCARSVG